MLSAKHAVLAIKVLSLSLVAALSFFAAASALPESAFVRDSLESIEDSSSTVMRFSAASLSASLAISALPDDFATPLADSLADMNFYFVAILVVLFLEKILIRYGIQAAFAILILTNCLMPLLTVFILKWLLGEIFHITIPTPLIRRHRRTESSDFESDSEPVAAGEKRS